MADIGGSNARFGLILQNDMLVQYVRTIPVISHPDPVSAANAYLSEIANLLGAQFQAPRKAVFAVAAAVAGDEIEFTNSSWNFSKSAVKESLKLDAIAERGLNGTDAICSETIDTFCALLGSFAGNVALTLGARGGIYIDGGIVRRLGDRFFASRFRECFEAKGRFNSYLKDIPTALITNTLAALTGAALAIEQLGE